MHPLNLRTQRELSICLVLLGQQLGKLRSQRDQTPYSHTRWVPGAGQSAQRRKGWDGPSCLVLPQALHPQCFMALNDLFSMLGLGYLLYKMGSQ